jgi:hypothetical protein
MPGDDAAGRAREEARASNSAADLVMVMVAPLAADGGHDETCRSEINHPGRHPTREVEPLTSRL